MCTLRRLLSFKRQVNAMLDEKMEPLRVPDSLSRASQYYLVFSGLCAIVPSSMHNYRT